MNLERFHLDSVAVYKDNPTFLSVPVTRMAQVPADIWALVEAGQMPHMVWEVARGFLLGPPLQALLHKMYPAAAARQENVLRIDCLQNKGIEMVRDRIKPFCQKKASLFHTTVNFRLVILERADELTWEAQCALRRILEGSVRVARFIWVCEDASRIMEPIRSRCWEVSWSLPDADAIECLLPTTLDAELRHQIAVHCRHDVRRAMQVSQLAGDRASWLQALLCIPPSDCMDHIPLNNSLELFDWFENLPIPTEHTLLSLMSRFPEHRHDFEEALADIETGVAPPVVHAGLALAMAQSAGRPRRGRKPGFRPGQAVAGSLTEESID